MSARHGRTCSSDPEIGCECGLADRDPAMCLDCGEPLRNEAIPCPCHWWGDHTTYLLYDES